MTCKKFVKFFEWCISDHNSSTTSMMMSQPPDDMDIDGHSNSNQSQEGGIGGGTSTKVSSRSHPLVILKHYEDNFLYHLKKLIDIFHFSTVESSIFSSLLIRLDYNQYYYHLQSLSIGPSTLNMNLGQLTESNTKAGEEEEDEDENENEDEEEEEEEEESVDSSSRPYHEGGGDKNAMDMDDDNPSYFNDSSEME